MWNNGESLDLCDMWFCWMWKVMHSPVYIFVVTMLIKLVVLTEIYTLRAAFKLYST